MSGTSIINIVPIVTYYILKKNDLGTRELHFNVLSSSSRIKTVLRGRQQGDHVTPVLVLRYLLKNSINFLMSSIWKNVQEIINNGVSNQSECEENLKKEFMQLSVFLNRIRRFDQIFRDDFGLASNYGKGVLRLEPTDFVDSEMADYYADGLEHIALLANKIKEIFEAKQSIKSKTGNKYDKYFNVHVQRICLSTYGEIIQLLFNRFIEVVSKESYATFDKLNLGDGQNSNTETIKKSVKFLNDDNNLLSNFKNYSDIDIEKLIQEIADNIFTLFDYKRVPEPVNLTDNVKTRDNSLAKLCYVMVNHIYIIIESYTKLFSVLGGESSSAVFNLFVDKVLESWEMDDVLVCYLQNHYNTRLLDNDQEPINTVEKLKDRIVSVIKMAYEQKINNTSLPEVEMNFAEYSNNDKCFVTFKLREHKGRTIGVDFNVLPSSFRTNTNLSRNQGRHVTAVCLQREMCSRIINKFCIDNESYSVSSVLNCIEEMVYRRVALFTFYFPKEENGTCNISPDYFHGNKDINTFCKLFSEQVLSSNVVVINSFMNITKEIRKNYLDMMFDNDEFFKLTEAKEVPPVIKNLENACLIEYGAEVIQAIANEFLITDAKVNYRTFMEIEGADSSPSSGDISEAISMLRKIQDNYNKKTPHYKATGISDKDIANSIFYLFDYPRFKPETRRENTGILEVDSVFPNLSINRLCYVIIIHLMTVHDSYTFLEDLKLFDSVSRQFIDKVFKQWGLKETKELSFEDNRCIFKNIKNTSQLKGHIIEVLDNLCLQKVSEKSIKKGNFELFEMLRTQANRYSL